MISSTIASAGLNGSRATPGSPWMPMPISISSGPISKFGRRVCGSEHGPSATPIVNVRSFAHRAARSTSSSGQHQIAGRARRLEDEEVARHPAPGRAPVARRRGDVVGRQHGADLDVLHRRHLGGHVEVHHVAGVVAVHEEHARAAAGCLGTRQDRIGRRRGEDVADRGRVGETPTDEAQERRLVTGPAADHQPDLARARPFARNHRPPMAGGPLEMPRVRGEDAVEHLVDRVVPPIQDLLGTQGFPRPDRPAHLSQGAPDCQRVGLPAPARYRQRRQTSRIRTAFNVIPSAISTMLAATPRSPDVTRIERKLHGKPRTTA